MNFKAADNLIVYFIARKSRGKEFYTWIVVVVEIAGTLSQARISGGKDVYAEITMARHGF